MAELVRQGDPEEIAGVLLDIILGRVPIGVQAGTTPTCKDRIEAIKVYFDRVAGKPYQTTYSTSLSASVSLPSEWSSMSQEARRAWLDSFQRKALGGEQ